MRLRPFRILLCCWIFGLIQPMEIVRLSNDRNVEADPRFPPINQELQEQELQASRQLTQLSFCNESIQALVDNQRKIAETMNSIKSVIALMNQQYENGHADRLRLAKRSVSQSAGNTELQRVGKRSFPIGNPVENVLLSVMTRALQNEPIVGDTIKLDAEDKELVKEFMAAQSGGSPEPMQPTGNIMEQLSRLIQQPKVGENTDILEKIKGLIQQPKVGENTEKKEILGDDKKKIKEIVEALQKFLSKTKEDKKVDKKKDEVKAKNSKKSVKEQKSKSKTGKDESEDRHRKKIKRSSQNRDKRRKEAKKHGERRHQGHPKYKRSSLKHRHHRREKRHVESRCTEGPKLKRIYQEPTFQTHPDPDVTEELNKDNANVYNRRGKRNPADLEKLLDKKKIIIIQTNKKSPLEELLSSPPENEDETVIDQFVNELEDSRTKNPFAINTGRKPLNITGISKRSSSDDNFEVARLSKRKAKSEERSKEQEKPKTIAKEEEKPENGKPRIIIIREKRKSTGYGNHHSKDSEVKRDKREASEEKKEPEVEENKAVTTTTEEPDCSKCLPAQSEIPLVMAGEPDISMKNRGEIYSDMMDERGAFRPLVPVVYAQAPATAEETDPQYREQLDVMKKYPGAPRYGTNLLRPQI